MKRILYSIILFIFSLSNPLLAQTDTLPNELGKTTSSPEGLKIIIDSKDTKFVIVDVRPDTAYQNGHIPTAISISGAWISDIKNPPPKDKYLILYCHNGLTAPAAGERLQADGYKYIFVWGGIADWPYDLVSSE